MNVKFNDSNLIVKYLEAFLQIESDNTSIVSGIYDRKTHQNLINYLNLPEVKDVYSANSAIVQMYPEIEQYFKKSLTASRIIYICPSTTPGIDSVVEILRGDGRISLHEFVITLGWSLTDFISYEDNSDFIKITIDQDIRKNLIPKSALSLINQNIDNYLVGYKINQSGTIVLDENYSICLIPAKPNQKYYVGMKVPYTLGESTNLITDDLEFSTVSHRVDDSSMITYTTSDTVTMIVISFQFTDLNYRQPAWMLELNGDLMNIDPLAFSGEDWAIHSKFFDYLYGQSITEYSDDDSLTYLGELLMKVYPYDGIEKPKGIWDDLYREILIDYQKRKEIPMSLGWLDPLTESLLLRDADAGVRYKVGEGL